MTLTALALSGMLPAFSASPAPTITGYAAANTAAVPITSAAPGAWSPTQILVTVPAAASYPFTGPVTVTAGGQTANGPAFTITAPPPMLRPGDLDPSFGTGGKVVTAFGGPALANAVILLTGAG